jgi:hypothetical protein
MRGNNLTILAPGTFLRGDLISGDTLVVEGGVEGNVKGNRVIVKAQGWVHGDVVCRSLSIEPGGVVDGAVRVEVESGGFINSGTAVEQASLPEGRDEEQAESGDDRDDGQSDSDDDDEEGENLAFKLSENNKDKDSPSKN